MKAFLAFVTFVAVCMCQVDKWHLLNSDSEAIYSDAPGAHPKGRRNAAAWCTDDDEVYIFGGRDGNERLSDLWRYEEATDRWIWIMDTPIKGMSGMVYWSSRSGRDFWIYGGRDDAGNVYDELWRYKRNTRVWERQQMTGNGPGPRYGAAFWYRPVSSSLYLYGGKSNHSVVEEDMWSLDTRTLQWTLLKEKNAPGAIDDAQAALSSSTGKAYVFGGEYGDDTLSPNTLWELDLETDTWTSLGQDGPDSREDLVMWFDVSQRSLFVFGGKTHNRALGEVWKYDIESGAWSETETSEATPSPRWGTTVCIDDEGYAFLFGGTTLDQTHMHNDVWKYGQIYSRPLGGLFDDLDRVSGSALVAAAMSTLLFVAFLVAVFGTLIYVCVKKRNRHTVM